MRVSARHIALIAILVLTGCLSSNQLLFQELSNAVPRPAGAHSGGTGTAFFISDDGILLTAAHVVRQCLRIGVVSEAVAPTTAAVIATYDQFDLALLRVGSQVFVPATLRMKATAPSSSERFKIYGYPGGADLHRPSAIDAKLVNDRFTATADGAFADPRLLVLLDGPVEPGYSGGPVIGSNGAVVGVIRGGAKEGSDLAPYSLAMGIRLIYRLTANVELNWPDAPIRIATGGDGKAVQSAIVRVICWKEATSSEK